MVLAAHVDTSQLRPLTLEVGNVQTPLFAQWKAIASAFVYGKGVGCGASCAVMYHPTLNTAVDQLQGQGSWKNGQY